nr:plastid division protein CDP1, chloroplastic-like [Coffea arabica]
MATLHLPTPSNCCCAYLKTLDNNHNDIRKKLKFCGHFDVKWVNYSSIFGLRARILNHNRGLVILSIYRRRCWRFYANADLRVVVESGSSSRNNINVVHSQSPIVPSAEIPITCYQILGVSDQAEKDEIVKSAMHLRNAQIEEGYTADVVVSRQNLLMDVRDKLLFEPEYAGNTKEKVAPKSSLRIPWSWVPAALCLLQEAGEDKIVLDIGRRALQHGDAKSYIHDVLLSMALAECSIAKACFEKNKISQGFEALARAQCLLRSKSSLGKMTLLSEIEESLEELAPACTLELLGMPYTPENAERRSGAISALRELLRQGLDVQSSSQVQDWPIFLNQALRKLMATEIVELLPWEDLALTRKNKKSLESQSQRVVIDFNCFYVILIAHIALGFSSKQKDLIHKAKTICECLISSEGTDLKFEEAFCLFLLDQGDEATAAEKLWQLELNSSPAARKLLSDKEAKDVSNSRKSLETWLKDSVLQVFPDTQETPPSFVIFFAGEKQTSGNRQPKRSLHTTSNMSHQSLTSPLVLDRKAFEDSIPSKDASRHVGPAVKQLTPANLQGPLTENKANSGANVDVPIQLKRNLGSHQNKAWDIWSDPYTVVRKLMYITSLGCIIYASFRLMNMHFYKMGNSSRWRLKRPTTSSSISWSKDFSLDENESRNAKKLKKFLSMLKIQMRPQPEVGSLQKSCLAASLSSSGVGVLRQPMPVEEAETLVRKWQDIKAEALGPNHHVQRLFDILDESMLGQWQALADAAKAKSCFWKFVLLQLSVLKADILTDETGNEMAEIEAILEEAAELVDDSQPKNPNYYSTYKIRYYLKRQYDGSWRFCEGDIQAPL